MKKEAMLYEKLEGGKVHCFLCAHHCKIAPKKYGFCGVRQNQEGTLYTLVYGEIIARHVDPVEKKPLYHFFPGSHSYSIATIGCNFHCGFCQNWQISQVSKKKGGVFERPDVMPGEVVEDAKRSGCRSIAYTYTEPTIFFEYAYDTARLAKEAGLYNIFVSNGFMTRDALDLISPYLDAVNVDLKAWSEDYYTQNCKARLGPVLDSIRHMRELGIWIEITTLVIPGENDSEEEMGQIARFISETSKDIPWHISRFYPDYQFKTHQATPIPTLERAREIGRREGLRYVYLGNVPNDHSTHCYNCDAVLVRRPGYGVSEMNLVNGKCPRCGTVIEGIWG